MTRRAATGSAAAIAAALLVWVGCAPHDPTSFTGLGDAPTKLSAFGLFAGPPAEQRPAEGVVPYDLTTPLFSDYSEKYRFVKLPTGTSATYQADLAFDFPVGTVLAKTFSYPVDARDPSQGRRLLETRILAHLEDDWIGLAYVWNEEQSDATLRIAGTRLDVSWIDGAGQVREHGYLVPNANQCKGCHRATEAGNGPLGPKARYLNRDFAYEHGTGNQLAHWSEVGILEGAPPPDSAPRTAVWDDSSSGSVQERARAYLEINCAHCHNPEGPARTTGLDLSLSAAGSVDLGVYKFPVAAGRGSGDRLYGIVPGEPDQSILMYRMVSVDPGVMMPELGRRLVHDEGVQLLREWIATMPPPTDRFHSEPAR
jgi:uncharacterized repeat protein (TIGR03806 family)